MVRLYYVKMFKSYVVFDVLFPKIKMSEESVSVNMQEFAFKPKEKLPTVPRYTDTSHSL